MRKAHPTAGPWFLNEAQTVILARNPRTDDNAPMPLVIAYTAALDPGGGSQANARLLAAAPELLAVADRFFSFYELHKAARGGQLGREYEELRAKIMGAPSA